ncbi:MAG: pyruvate, phosphate dikinase [Candidatus Margulisiibacteriota bacterium]|nr:MAG: pyruvate, phosphate dikinase [Candidatus Margulisbacteria bacterium GWD2_39_127]OGI02758.1 MAG: pyruvate, phosphate dikinase [Candidatus Margulisbacteria bacterium GWF2_38_17]OGI09355.1 MAG: pyruvate, phosphate dikinase [Candidatus Margulisbacteria bacterium GWE2_39_32]PZM77430.1 MAG: pyruvate, phosphate dikinase [Candidatus Margulisiibacteriota bacterium]HAR64007.1 pyruvate, phosphate dikinase [Candidatus Margulisiibacteriota bacterium]
MANKQVYFFGNGKADGNGKQKDLLGGKGAGLAEMTNSGVAVPAGFTITTEVCDHYYKNGKQMPADLDKEVSENIVKLEASMGMKLGDPSNPLLVSVRSGARESMPGMMDTVLNLGINDKVVEGIIKKTNNPRFAWDSYRRFIQMFSDVAMDVPKHHFEEALTEEKNKFAKKTGRDPKEVKDTDLSADDLKELVNTYKQIFKKEKGEDFPQDPLTQLWASIAAVFNSWNNERAIVYRQKYSIKGLLGTAVNVQAMVFGNMGDTSATGVCFSRNPANGENKFYGEFLINAQGEDVVAGIRTPQKISLESSQEWSEQHGISEADRKSKYPSLEEIMPEAYKQLITYKTNLEKHYRDMQDMEFTIQDGKLYMLQTRNAKRTGFAAIKCAVDMVNEGMIVEKEAVLRVNADQLNEVLRPIFDTNDKVKAQSDDRVLARGLNAGPGAACGQVYFSASEAVEAAEVRKEKVILVRIETTPEDIKGMIVAEGILTAMGGATSHAAVVARQLGTVCVAGCGKLNIDYAKQQMSVGSIVIKQGEFLSIDGFTGEVIAGKIKTKPSEILQVMVEKTLDPSKSELYLEYDRLMKWASGFKKIGIRTNADQPDQSLIARTFGAEGIGLCRTEHMFFGGDRIKAVREMILSDNVEGRLKALVKLLPMQKTDFYDIFKAMEGLPVTIRLLDPPLHEFLPTKVSEIEELAKDMNVSVETLNYKVKSLHEFNPMLGHRGCRLGITYPEIYDMQVKAIIQAAIDIKKSGKDIVPEIMIPLVGDVKELSILKGNAIKVIDEEMKAAGVTLQYMIGTMIEVPRAAITADAIAKEAEFFSFGTNDLTQMTCGFSRDDSGNFLGEYVEKGIYDKDPFQVLDQVGVGELMKIAIEKGKKTNPKIKLGICGEHGGEPATVEFCHNIGLTYVSCSPYRVPIACLAAAHAALKESK